MNNDYEELKEYLSELEEEEWNRETKLYWLGRFDQRLELGVINIEEYQDLLKVARITDEDIFRFLLSLVEFYHLRIGKKD